MRALALSALLLATAAAGPAAPADRLLPTFAASATTALAMYVS